MKETNSAYYFIVMASLVIVLAGIKSASELIVPFLLSLFLAIILLPTYNFFNKKGLPSLVSLTLVIGGFVFAIMLVLKLIGSSVSDFNANIDNYSVKLIFYYSYIVSIADKMGITISVEELSNIINSKQIMSFISNIIQSIGSIFTNSFVVLLTVIFMLLESSHFKDKIDFIVKKNKSILNLDKIILKIKEYMVLKSLISILTGLIIWIALYIVGTDYAFLWAVFAFLFNFIPNIGSIIASVPAFLLTLIQLGPISAVSVAIIYLSTNIIVGSVIEPKIMGRGLGLSTLVVFLSLVFWGWLLGIVGMLLSIPLTIIAKIMLAENKKTKWIAILLGNGESLQAR